jgi:MFS family permease
VKLRVATCQTLPVVDVDEAPLMATLAAAVPGQKAGPFAWKTVSGWAEGFFAAAAKRAGGIFRSVGKALATDFVPDRLRTRGLGWYNTTLGLMGLLASVVAGLLWDHVGHAAVFIYGAIFAVIGSIAFLALLPAEQIRRAA